jgi:diguanylate cyclase (GGDEF)-like protein
LASHRELLALTATVQSAHQALEGLIALAFIDPTTNLYNRRALDEITNLALGFEGPSFGVVMIDLTGFKRVNDEGGHAGGDAALGQVGKTLTDMCLSPLDPSSPLGLPFRYGGDEFCILVPSDNFETFVEDDNLRRMRWPDFTLEGKVLGFGASIGYASPDEEVGLSTALPEEVGLPTLIERADAAAKVSKHHDDEPVRWSSMLEQEDLFSARRRCTSCQATVTIQIPKNNLRPDFLLACAHCEEPLA